MDAVHQGTFWRQQLLGRALSASGIIAVLLVASGLYGVLSYVVSHRRREMSLRMALGAQGRDVVRLVVSRGMTMVLTGIIIGLVGAFAVTRVARGQLYEVSATDPLSFLGAALLLAGVGWLASHVPARRAANVDPAGALRE